MIIDLSKTEPESNKEKSNQTKKEISIILKIKLNFSNDFKLIFN